MAHKYYLTSFWIVTFSAMLNLTGTAQATWANIDSLRQIWYAPDGQVPDEVLLNTSYHIQHYYQNTNYDSLWAVAQLLKTRGLKKNNQIWINHSHHWMAVYYNSNGNPKAGIANLLYSIEHSPDSEFIKNISLARLGLTYKDLNQKDSALFYYQKALSTGEQYGYIKNYASFYAVTNFDIGEIYALKGKYVEALEHYTKGKNIILSSPNPRSTLNRFGAIQTGIVFKKLGLYDEAKTCYDEALTYPPNYTSPNTFLRSTRLLISIAPNLNEVRRLAQQGQTILDTTHLPAPASHFYMVVGEAFLDSLQYDQAKYYFTKAMGLAKAFHQESNLSIILLNLSDIDSRQHRYQKSLKTCRQIQATIEKSKTTDQLIQLYGVMSHNFEHLGQPDSALFYLKKKNLEEAKIGSKEALKANISAFLKFRVAGEQKLLESAKKQAEALSAESNAKTTLTILFSSLIILILAGALVVSNYYYRQKKHLVSELEKSGNSLKAKHDKLQVSNEHLNRFTNVVSHDILSNLDLILSTGNLFYVGDGDVERLKKYYKISQQTAQNLKKYCIELLQHTKTHTLVKDQLFDPMPVLDKVLKQFEWSLEEKGIVVDVQPLPATPIQPVHTTHIFFNLISNVLRYASSHHQPRLSIRGSQSEYGGVQWIIEDNGPGLPHQKWQEIRENEKSLSEKGNGLGLGQVVAVVQNYGASFLLEPPASGGTKFIIAFPV